MPAVSSISEHSLTGVGNTVRHENTITGRNTRKRGEERRRKKNSFYSHATENPRVSSKTVLGLIRKLGNMAGY